MSHAYHDHWKTAGPYVSALQFAAHEGSSEAVHILLNRGADIKIEGEHAV
jgi:hypothetical protein